MGRERIMGHCDQPRDVAGSKTKGLMTRKQAKHREAGWLGNGLELFDKKVGMKRCRYHASSYLSSLPIRSTLHGQEMNSPDQIITSLLFRSSSTNRDISSRGGEARLPAQEVGLIQRPPAGQADKHAQTRKGIR
jgi:hypothetical protein